MPDARDRLRTAILTLADQRAPKSICPSDAARAVDAENWRGPVRITARIEKL